MPEDWATHPMSLAMPEKTLQTNVMSLLRLFGWRAYHTSISYGSAGGFPDVCAVRARDGRLLFAELKRQRGKVTEQQQQWLDDLRVQFGRPDDENAGGIEVYVWRPSDWLSGDIERLLR